MKLRAAQPELKILVSGTELRAEYTLVGMPRKNISC